MATAPLTRPAAPPEGLPVGALSGAEAGFRRPARRGGGFRGGGFRGPGEALRVPPAGFVFREEPPRRRSWADFDLAEPDSTASELLDCGLAPPGRLRPRRSPDRRFPDRRFPDRRSRTETGDPAPGFVGLHPEERADTAADGPITAPEIARSFREEVTAVVETVLRGAIGATGAATFLAYHRLTGGPHRSIRAIAAAAHDRGCRTAPSRERVRIAAVEGGRILAEAAGRIRFRHWDSAVAEALERTPLALPRFLVHFGYRTRSRPEEVGESLRRMAGLFGLDFPFRFRAAGNEVWVTPDDPEEADRVVETVRRLERLRPAPWYEWEDAVRGATHPEAADLAHILRESDRWGFLDSGEGFFWRRPPLPPKRADRAGNTVLAMLLRQFAIGVEAPRETLLRALSRTRHLRRPVPEAVLVGIAEQSGLFEVTPQAVRRRPKLPWPAALPYDLALARLARREGPRLRRAAIESALTAAGAPPGLAAVEVSRSPFLVPTAIGRRAATYRFLFARRHLRRPEPEAPDSD